ncbi:tyramine/octopamine receptor-like isoform X2 [Venturia canescens]|uniref:tyramine/octopamine receptor-like isoform X2 n=1 Tax=Venturia canescens TaxID=32260 RepID=UPI001C9CAB6E|nr:tyramine/octopamine receptor-like isoform X2 [Venturia canescens]
MAGGMENCTGAYYVAAVDSPAWLYYKHNSNNNNNNGSNVPKGGSLADYGDVHPPSAPASTTEYLPDWTDLVLAALFSVLIVVTIINGGIWTLGEILCDSWVSLDVLLCTASILSLCAISIDRYLAVTQPLVYSRRRRSKRLAGLMIVVVWILAGIITSPPLLGCFPRATNRDREKCGYNMDSSYVVFSSMGSFFLPMLCMIYVYARISCVIARRHKSLQGSADAQNDYGSHRGKTPVAIGRERSKSCCTTAQAGGAASKRSEELSSVSDIGPGSSSEKIAEQRALPTDSTTTPAAAGPTGKKVLLAVPSRNQQRGSHQSSINRVTRETKTAGTLAVVVGGFIACWLPFFVLYLATPFIPVEPPDSLMSALTWLGWINSAINPFIYAFYSADFRLAFWRLTCRKCFKNVPQTASSALADRRQFAESKHWRNRESHAQG